MLFKRFWNKFFLFGIVKVDLPELAGPRFFLIHGPFRRSADFRPSEKMAGVEKVESPKSAGYYLPVRKLRSITLVR